MSDKFKEKYNIKSSRLETWDYGNQAAYFITICSHNMIRFFGDVIDGEMQLSKIGKIVKVEWLKTPIIRKDMNLTLDEFIVMPNHFHAIIIISENEYNSGNRQARRDAMHGVSTTVRPNTETIKRSGPQRKNLSSIVRGFKSSVTKQAHLTNPNFSWQPRFHDHIIRNEKSFSDIQNYIVNNPLKWADDKYYIEAAA